MEIEIRHLKLMRAVVASGSLTKAGRELHLSQSALSHQLRDIESRLGTPLFLRVGKRLVATAAGTQLQRSAADVLRALELTEDAIQRLAGGHRGVLRVSSGGYTEYHWLPPVLKAYCRVYPHVEVQIAAGSAGDPMALLLDGRLDVGLVCHGHPDPRVVEQPLFEDDLVVIVEPGHRLASRRFVMAADFAGETLLLERPRDESPLYQRVLLPTGVKPARTQVVPQSGAIIALVTAGLGIAVLARWAVEPAVKSGVLCALPLTKDGERCCWSAAVLKEMADLDYVRDFIDVVARHSPSARRPRLRGC